MSFPNIKFGTDGEQHEISTSARDFLGTQMLLADGRKFRYVKAGATALIPGNLHTGPVGFSSVASSYAIEAAVAGTKTLTLSTAIATSHPAGRFNDGWAVNITDGRLYKIASQPALTSAVASQTITLTHGIDVAVTSSVQLNLVQNQFNGVVICATTPNGPMAGWAVSSVAASGYGWLGTGGPVAGRIGAVAPAEYVDVTPCTSIAGAVIAYSSVANNVIVGSNMSSGLTSNQFGLLHAKLE